MKYGEITMGQLSRFLVGRTVRVQELGIPFDVTVEELLDNLVEEVIKSGRLLVCDDGVVIERIPMHGKSSVVRVTRGIEVLSAFAQTEEDAQQIISEHEKAHAVGEEEQ